MRRLRASGDVQDALALRLHLERALSVTELHPSGLSPNAILFVRKLGGRHARVQQSRLSSRAVRGRSVADAIEELARHAARPARYVVPADAEAVVFVDQAELLSCLALDLCDGTAPARWWWRSLFKSADISSALLKAWLAAPEYVPAALEQLSERGRLGEFARTLGEDHARVVLRGVLDKFALNELRRAFEGDGPHVEAVQHERQEAADVSSSSLPPWSLFVPQPGGESLGRWQSCLIGVGLMLLRAPSLVRASSFAEHVARWQRDAGRATHDAPATHTHAPGGPSTDSRRINFERTHEYEETESAGEGERSKESETKTFVAADAARMSEASGDDSRRVVSGVEGAIESATNEAAQGEVHQVAPEALSLAGGNNAARVDGSGRRESQASLLDENEGGVARRASNTPEEGHAPAADAADREFVAPLVYQARLTTEFGGLFYLVNLGLFLGFYGDFTTPMRPGIALSVWEFVASLGLRLCGERVKKDGVWSLLSSLAGRGEEEPLGRDFEPPDEWRMPSEWLAPFEGREAWEWTDEDARLRIRHPVGFLIIDVPLARKDGERQLTEEMQAYAQHPSPTLRRASPRRAGESGANERERVSEARAHKDERDERDRADEGDALRRWLDWLTPYVRARLSLALGAGSSEGELARLLCEEHAVVRLTETHLDVTFSLAQQSIEVRIAGLDRNPGWVPAGGRYIAFHYE
ncbi:MAG: hypothetical protein WCD76_00420 [Pyrinomonadaceae bacterium]